MCVNRCPNEEVSHLTSHEPWEAYLSFFFSCLMLGEAYLATSLHITSHEPWKLHAHPVYGTSPENDWKGMSGGGKHESCKVHCLLLVIAVRSAAGQARISTCILH